MKRIWEKRLQQLEEVHLTRTMRITGPGPIVNTPEGEKLIFCSNDYLGLAVHPRIAAAAKAALDEGVGAGASRLVSGNEPWHETLEERFAQLVQKENAVLFPSGYQANVGAVSALTQAGDVIFSDESAHASIIDGCRLSKATVEIFKHNDVTDLRRKLLTYADHDGVKLVVCEAIYSMDGDMPPLKDICDAATDAGAAVYLDEAHSLGILGPGGAGLAAAHQLSNRIDILIGTFGKATGVSGAAVACSPSVSRLLKSSARSLLYTTAPPACLSRAVCESLDMFITGDDLRTRLFQNIQLFRTLAAAKQIPLVQSETPIQPVVIGDAAKVMTLSNQLWERGLFVQGIRPPTVAPGTERLRITITAAHTSKQITRLVNELAALGVVA